MSSFISDTLMENMMHNSMTAAAITFPATVTLTTLGQVESKPVQNIMIAAAAAAAAASFAALATAYTLAGASMIAGGALAFMWINSDDAIVESCAKIVTGAMIGLTCGAVASTMNLNSIYFVIHI
jgi:hypothetical protein